MKTLFINPKSPEYKSDKVAEAVEQYWKWHNKARLRRGKESKLMNLEKRISKIENIANSFGVPCELLTKILIS